jgi:hypothetical protein
MSISLLAADLKSAGWAADAAAYALGATGAEDHQIMAALTVAGFDQDDTFYAVLDLRLLALPLQ